MKYDTYLDIFDTEEKAIDHAMWLNFKYRIAGIVFGVIPGPKRNFGQSSYPALFLKEHRIWQEEKLQEI